MVFELCLSVYKSKVSGTLNFNTSHNKQKHDMFLKKWRNIMEIKKYWKFVATVKNLLLSTIWALTLYEQRETFFGVLVKLCFAKVLKRFNNEIKFSKKQISVLSSVSQVFERLLQNQIVSYLNKFLLLYLCGTQQAFYFTIET